jgi:hypothetical protein
MLARAPELGVALADRLFREIDAYRDGTVVPRDEVRASCEPNLTFVFDSLAGHADADFSIAEHTGTTRALAGVPLPALMTAYRIGFRFMWEETLAAARAAGIPTESILEVTTHVFLAQDTFTQAMASAYRQQLTAQILEQEEERGVGRVAVSPNNRHAEPVGGSRSAPATHHRTVCRRGGRVTGDREIGLARDRKQALRPRHPIGLAAAAGPTHRRRSRAHTLHRRPGDFSHTPAATARVGISPPFHELAETSEALRFARLAVTGKPSGDSLVTVFDDTPLAVAAVSAPEVMAKIRSTVLKGLNQLPPAERTILLDTFQAWLQADGSANDTAATIFCHPNTVRHRLRRIEELTGRSLSAPKDLAELCLAFEVEQRLP